VGFAKLWDMSLVQRLTPGAQKNKAQALIDAYPAGKTVQVYHHPQSPGICVLEPGLFNISGIVLSGILPFLGLFGYPLFLEGKLVEALFYRFSEMGLGPYSVSTRVLISALTMGFLILIAWKSSAYITPTPLFHALRRANNDSK
jgi:hypothetical protein